MRGIAALIVAVHHVEWLHSFYYLKLIRHADFMLDFFFVLSGFCICHIYGNKISNRGDAKRFVILRFWRLYPLHFVFLLVLLIIEISKYFAVTQFGLTVNSPPFQEGTGAIFVGNLLMIHSLGIFERWAFNVPSWSISTEAFAYLLFVAIFLFQQKTSRRIYISTLCVLGAVIILAVFNQGSLIGNSVHFGLVRCMAGFFTGVLVYYLFSALRGTSNTVTSKGVLNIASCVLLIIFLVLPVYAWGTPMELLALPVMGALILTVALHEKGWLGWVFNRKPLLWIGKVSYSIYLSHLSVIFVFSQVLRFVLDVPLFRNEFGSVTYDTSPILGNWILLIYIASVLFVSHYSWRFIEDRYRRISKTRTARTST